MLIVKKLIALLLFLFVTNIYAETLEIGAENGAGLWGKEDGETGCGNDIVVAAFKAVGIELN